MTSATATTPLGKTRDDSSTPNVTPASGLPDAAAGSKTRDASSEASTSVPPHPSETEKSKVTNDAEGEGDADEEDEISFAEADLPPAPKTSDGIIDEETFSQIREMDDPDDPELFSAGIVFGFFDQAEQTFGEMRRAISEKNLEQLSSLGHFLKGSSAALGVFKVQAICETIQNNGKMRDEVRDENITSEDALKRIKDLLRNAELEYRIAKAWFLKLYPDGGPEGGDEED